MSEPREERCERCRFCHDYIWGLRRVDERPIWECRINPPTAAHNWRAAFPIVEPNDWCGKFEPKPAPPT